MDEFAISGRFWFSGFDQSPPVHTTMPCTETHKRVRKLWTSLALGAAIVASPLATLKAQVAVVVGSASPVSALTFDEVRRVFEGKSPKVAGVSVVVGFGAAAQDKFCTKVYDATPDNIRKRWAALVFQGEVAAMPPVLADDAAIKKFLASNPGAVAIIPSASVDGSMKVIKIDGALPADAAYKIK
jgi:hypothetical protein